ncbi:MAG TPA: hypothetical protein IAA63_13180 [Candidatus Pullilachnospira stercoravium]|uniref:Uncharacterized protein n=1 Tax=Candidatus Pullilachnospira stercoravium TaxID=2840913 RepID=A0A9D1NWH1_9FIRM|nr:hypothetical protein [Candidatus Pullilachnospira stercoravium]
MTVDQLIGYEPQLSEQQIRKIYQELSGDFVKLSFDEAIEKCRKLVKTYYACYPFLYQIGNLWLNHVSLAASPKQQEELLRDILQLYNRVLTGSRDAQLQADARIMKALILMMLGEAQEAARLLEPMTHPQRLQNQCGSLVIQVFQMLGQDQKARSTAQIQCYLHLQQLLDISVRLLELEQTDEKKGLETIRRLRQLIETWQLEKLMPNQTLKFFYQSAVYFCCHGKREEALKFCRKCETPPPSFSPLTFFRMWSASATPSVYFPAERWPFPAPCKKYDSFPETLDLSWHLPQRRRLRIFSC